VRGTVVIARFLMVTLASSNRSAKWRLAVLALLFDGRVTHPGAATYVQGASVRRRLLAAVRERTKDNKYEAFAAAAAGVPLSPFVMET
jgi:hypothetical protein